MDPTQVNNHANVWDVDTFIQRLLEDVGQRLQVIPGKLGDLRKRYSIELIDKDHLHSMKDIRRTLENCVYVFKASGNPYRWKHLLQLFPQKARGRQGLPGWIGLSISSTTDRNPLPDSSTGADESKKTTKPETSFLPQIATVTVIRISTSPDHGSTALATRRSRSNWPPAAWNISTQRSATTSVPGSSSAHSNFWHSTPDQLRLTPAHRVMVSATPTPVLQPERHRRYTIITTTLAQRYKTCKIWHHISHVLCQHRQ